MDVFNQYTLLKRKGSLRDGGNKGQQETAVGSLRWTSVALLTCWRLRRKLKSVHTKATAPTNTLAAMMASSTYCHQFWRKSLPPEASIPKISAILWRSSV